MIKSVCASIGANPVHVGPLSHCAKAALDSTQPSESRLEAMIAAADDVDASSSGLLSTLWDYLGYLNTHLRGAFAGFTWEAMLRNVPFNFGTLIDEAYRIAEASASEISRLLSDFARRCIALFDWLLGADLLKKDSDEVRAQQEKDVILEHATKARSESQGLVNILSRAGSATIAIGKAFVSGILFALTKVEEVYHVAINKCTEMVATAFHRMAEWTMTNSKSVALEMTRFFLFLIAAGERMAFVMGYALQVAAIGVVKFLESIHATLRDYFGSVSTKLLNFLTEVVRPFVKAKETDPSLEAQMGDSEVGTSVFSGFSRMASIGRLVMWLINMIQGGAVRAVIQATIMGLLRGIKNAAVMLVATLLPKVPGHHHSEFVSVTERIAMIQALQVSTGYTYVSKQLREQADRQINAALRLSAEIEEEVRKNIRKGKLISMLSSSIGEAWTSSRASARFLFGETLSEADTKNSGARAATFAMISPGRMKNMDELQVALMRTHHAIAAKIDRHYSRVAQAADGIDEPVASAGAPEDEDRTHSPPGVSLLAAQRSWVSFMDAYSGEYRGYGKLISDTVPNDPEDIRIAIEWLYWDRNNGRITDVIRDIIELMLRRLYEEAKSKLAAAPNRSLADRGFDLVIGGSTTFTKDDIDDEIAAMRKAPLDEALNSLKIQYDAVVADRSLVVLPLSSRDQALESRQWRNTGRMIIRGASFGTGGMAAFQLPPQVSVGLSSMLVAMSEMTFVDGEEEYYSQWARRVAFIKPIIMALSITLFIWYSASKITNEQYGFDLSRLAVPGREFSTTDLVGAPANLKNVMRAWVLLGDKQFRDALTKHESKGLVDRWEAFGAAPAQSATRTHDEAFALARDTVAALHTMVGNALGGHQWKTGAKASAYLLQIQNDLYALKTETIDAEIIAIKEGSKLAAATIFDRTIDATFGRVMRYFNPAFTWAMQPRILMNQFLAYALKGYLVFAVGTVVVSFIIDAILLILERARRAQMGLPTKELSLKRLTMKYVAYGMAFGQLGFALWQHSIQQVNNEIVGLVSTIPGILRAGTSLVGAGAAFYAGDPLTGGTMLLQSGSSALDAFMTGANIAAGGVPAPGGGGTPQITN